MATSAQTMDTKRAPVSSTGLIVAIVLAVAGIAAWIYQLLQGMQVTALGQQVVWGLYIAGFFTAVGAGAGLLALTGLSEFSPLTPIAYRPRLLILALTSFIIGGLFITLDLGSPLTLWRLIIGFRFSSLMTWDFWLLVIATVVTLAYLWVGRGAQAQKGLGALGVLSALAVVVVEGWMLSVLSARPMWSGGLVVVSFLLGATIAGLSLALIGGISVEKVRGWLIAALVLNLVLVLSEVLTGLLSADPRTAEEMRLLVAGSDAPVFWFHLLVGLVLPLALLVMNSGLKWAAALAVLGVVAEKVWLLSAGQAKPWLDLPEASYFPSWVEWVAFVGLLALGVLVYLGITSLVKPSPEPKAA